MFLVKGFPVRLLVLHWEPSDFKGKVITEKLFTDRDKENEAITSRDMSCKPKPKKWTFFEIHAPWWFTIQSSSFQILAVSSLCDFVGQTAQFICYWLGIRNAYLELIEERQENIPSTSGVGYSRPISKLCSLLNFSPLPMKCNLSGLSSVFCLGSFACCLLRAFTDTSSLTDRYHRSRFPWCAVLQWFSLDMCSGGKRSIKQINW